MIRRTVRLAIPDGLHARPCSAIAQAMKRFKGTLEIRLGVARADARSVLQMMTLNAGVGAEIDLLASGEDAEEIVAAVVAIIG
ncbi:MAG: HPr family phosphocarrier protein [Planctomycetes bacterium]|nr:HPr family phosphocarrier protein [Planctomycetota bacterium]